MKTIGMIGGMSWHSTAEYYRIINETVHQKLGGQHSARIILSSMDFDPLVKLAAEGKWDEYGMVLCEEAKKLEESGADFFVICSNATHFLAERVANAVDIPLLHIADATSAEIQVRTITKVGLLGTRQTMDNDFYRAKLSEHGITAIIPDESSKSTVDSVIFDELVKGSIRDESRDKFLEIINSLIARGAQGIILGCTEIPLLVRQEDTGVPVFDTLSIHAEATAKFALQ